MYTVDGACVLGEFYLNNSELNTDNFSLIQSKNIITLQFGEQSSGNIVYPGLIAAWSAKGKTNDDEDRATLRDLTGNGHDITLNRFAFSEMSGYGGYGVYSISSWLTYASNNYTKYGRHKIEITVNDYNFVISISKNKTKINDVFKLKFDRPNIVSQFVGCEITQINELEYSFKIVDLSINPILVLNKEALGQVITIEQIPEYPGALVFDGVDDHISLDAFDSGFKTVFISCVYYNKNKFIYDQRGIDNKEGFGIYTFNSNICYKQTGKATTFINGILNTKLYPDSTINKIHVITMLSNGTLYPTIPIIGRTYYEYATWYQDMALYKFLGFKEALTEEQIQTVIKKYNLLDGVDEIEIS